MTIEKTVLVPLGPDETFAMLTDPERLRRWQAVTARIDVQAGGTWRWTITPGHSAAGSVVEIEPGRRLVLSFGWEGDEHLPPGASVVTVTLEPTDGGTVVRLIHTGLTEDQATGHASGWEHYLGRLADAARSGDAGADPWAASPDPIDRLAAAEASLAICQAVLHKMQRHDATQPTPCAKFTVSDLVAHLSGSLDFLGAAAGADISHADKADNEDNVESIRSDGNPWEPRVAASAQRTLEAWRARGTDGLVALGGGDVPAEMAATLLSIELLVHAWDLARACSWDLDVSEELAGYVLGLARDLITPEIRGHDRFAEALEPPPGAKSIDQLVAFTGRSNS